MNVYSKDLHSASESLFSDQNLTFKESQLQTDNPQWVEIFASWSRIIEGAPLENKPRLFFMMARDAAAWANAHRQQAVDDMWTVAAELRLVELLGTVTVQDVLAAAFGGEA